MQNKKVIYTAIFGGKDALHEPLVIPSGFDFICFTDNKKLVSKNWNIRVVNPLFSDPVRNARYYKILVHKVLPEYDQSIWIDGNMIVKGDCNKLIDQYLKKDSFVTYDHSKQKRRLFKFFWVIDRKLARNCIYDELEDLVLKTKSGMYMDNIDIMKNQIERYKKEGYPAHNGLAVTMVLLRNHKDLKVVELMEDWWREVSLGSRRDQLSLNYVAWKKKMPIAYVSGDPRYSPYFIKTRHTIKNNFK